MAPAITVADDMAATPSLTVSSDSTQTGGTIAGSVGSGSPSAGTAATSAAGTGTGTDGAAPADTASSSVAPVQSDAATTLTSADLAPSDPAAVPGSGRGPPAGSVLIYAAQGGSVSSGPATLTFAPGSLPADAYVSITPTTVTLLGATSTTPAYDLLALNAVTGAKIEQFNSPPVLSIAGAPAGSQIYYDSPTSGPQAIGSSYDAATGSVSAGLPHFSTYYFSGTSFTVDVTGGTPPATVTITGTAPGDTLQIGSGAGGITVTDTTSAETSTFGAPSASLTITAPGETVELLAGALNLAGATLAVTAQNVTVDAGAVVIAASISLGASTSDTSSSATGATLAGDAQTLIDGSLSSPGAVSISASVTHTIDLTGQTLSSQVTFTLGSTAIAEIQSGASVSAGSLAITATTTINFTWTGNDSSVSYTEVTTNPDGQDGAVIVNPTDETHAGIASGAAVTVSGTGASSTQIKATDSANIATTITDTTDYGTLTATAADDFLQFGLILASVNMSRDTEAYIRGTPASGNTLDAATGGAVVSAENNGNVSNAVISTIVGKADNEIARDDALAFVNGASVSAGSLALSALTDTEYSSTAKVAINSVTGSTKATSTGSMLAIGAGGLGQDANDQTVLSAISSDAVYAPDTALVELTTTAAENTLTRNTEASIGASTVTAPGGDLALTAAGDGHVLAWTQSISDS
ncbi:MAG: beta strand repeat-containing protein, partial [Mycobacteriales bacterium]